jgi:Cu/Ag efflux pump CusA
MIEWIIRRSVANRFLVMMGPVSQHLGHMDDN